MGPLQDLGVSADAEALYLVLVEHGRQEVDALAARLATGPDRVRAAAAELAVLGLVAPSGTGSESEATSVAPLPPRTAIEGLAEARAREAQTARQSAQVLGELWTAHAEGPSYLEVLATTEAVVAAFRALNDRARTLVRSLSIGPVGPVRVEPSIAPGVEDALARGVEYRVVYGASILQHPAALRAATACIAAGEKARVYRDVPLNLVIGEGGVLLTAAATGGERLHGMLIGPSDLYDRLVALFEVFWSLALPLTADTGADGDEPVVPPVARRLVTLMAAGLTDESIARELGVSERTVARRIARLQHDLGVHSRFQLGVQASRRGLL